MRPLLGPVNRRGRVALAACAAVALLALATGWSAAQAGAAAVPLPLTTCTPVEYGGAGVPDAIIATDLPMQGASALRSAQMKEAVFLALERRGWTAGSVTVGLQGCDDSDAATGAWVKAICDANAARYAANPSVHDEFL